MCVSICIHVYVLNYLFVLPRAWLWMIIHLPVWTISTLWIFHSLLFLLVVEKIVVNWQTNWLRSKIQSLIASFFTSVYVTKWKEFFPLKELKYPPSFRARVICCATIEVLQAYFSWRQNDCKWSPSKLSKQPKYFFTLKFNFAYLLDQNIFFENLFIMYLCF